MRKDSFRKELLYLPTGPVAFYHNMTDTFGSNIEGAMDNWEGRTAELTLASFAAYIESKKHITGHTILTEEQYNNLT